MKKGFCIAAFWLLCCFQASAQCCSAGSASPIAGGTSQGVLQSRQMEVNLNFQHLSTNKFLDGDSPDKKFLDYYGSNYTYLRLAYGVTSKLTLSVEEGYYFNKTQIGLDKRDTMRSSGISDFIVFPRYTVYSRNVANIKDEVTVGLGYKIPLGKYNDSLRQVEKFSGEVYYVVMPPAVQPTNGSQDLIFYLFAYHGLTDKNLRFFANGLYIKRGWNPDGLKFGDYASVGLFASKTVLKKFGVTLQLKGEWVDKVKYNEYLHSRGYYQFDVKATGTKKVSFVPQLSYTYKAFTIYGSSDIPLYQYVTGKQIAAQRQFNLGLTYRFLTYKPIEE